MQIQPNLIHKIQHQLTQAKVE